MGKGHDEGDGSYKERESLKERNNILTTKDFLPKT
jgi:hypothetical protein